LQLDVQQYSPLAHEPPSLRHQLHVPASQRPDAQSVSSEQLWPFVWPWTHWLFSQAFEQQSASLAHVSYS
jgi:hypothetical protein